jgi:hypothetical protein
MKVQVEYIVDSCEECPYFMDELNGYRISPMCTKISKTEIVPERIDVDCPYSENNQTRIN